MKQICVVIKIISIYFFAIHCLTSVDIYTVYKDDIDKNIRISIDNIAMDPSLSNLSKGLVGG